MGDSSIETMFYILVAILSFINLCFVAYCYFLKKDELLGRVYNVDLVSRASDQGALTIKDLYCMLTWWCLIGFVPILNIFAGAVMIIVLVRTIIPATLQRLREYISNKYNNKDI